jgi:hypothetical protein
VFFNGSVVCFDVGVVLIVLARAVVLVKNCTSTYFAKRVRVRVRARARFRKQAKLGPKQGNKATVGVFQRISSML